MTVTKKLCFYNSRGFSDEKQRFCFNLFNLTGDFLPILCNQENFLYKSSAYKVQQALPGAFIFFKPAHKDCPLSGGRPQNGMFIAIPQCLKSVSTNISPLNWRLQAIKIQLETASLVIINSYFPNDPHTANFDDAELNIVLEEIRALIHGHDFDYFLLLGDLNTDFSRRSGHVKTVREFIEEYDLVAAWDNYDADFSNVNEINGISSPSLIDHFFWNSAASDIILESGILHLLDNISDHNPIYCKMVLKMKNNSNEGNFRINKSKPCWKNAAQDERQFFYSILSDDLKSIDIPENYCDDVHCRDPDHIQGADDYLDRIVTVIENACDIALPRTNIKTSNHTKKVEVGWNDEVRQYQNNAQFWHAIWISAGRPINCQLHNIMKRTRNVYHLMLRKCRKARDKIKANKLLEACLNDNKNIFVEVRKLRRCKPDVVNNIDGVTDEVENHFADIYEDLYTSVDDRTEVQDIKYKLEEEINHFSKEEVKRVTPEIVKEAINKLNNGKTDPSFIFTSDCFKAAPDILASHISNLFRIFLVHSHVSSVLLLATLLPLIKDKLGDHSSSKNYRSIAISSLFLKIFDWVVLLLYGHHLHLDDLQFGYQEDVSGTMCTWLALETISYFISNGSDVFSCVMDMTKAFDKIKHSVLFKKLMQTPIPPIFIRLILVMYQLQSADISWNQQKSRRFSLSNGVKQGAVLSAILYCFYSNGLFTLLRNRRNGCWMFNNYAGIVGYADDNWLLAPTREALQDMINTCAEYAEEHNLTFSTDKNPNKSKTKCMIFLKKQRNIEPLKLAGNNLPFTNTAKHLGHFLDNTRNSIKKDMKIKRAMAIQKNNEICQEFYFSHPETKLKLNLIYNFSYTGSQLWDLFSQEAISLEKSFNVSVRTMLGLPVTTHKYLIQPLAGGIHVKQVFARRFLKFCEKLKSSKKAVVRDTYEKIKLNVRSTTGRNLAELALLVGKNIEELSPKDSDSVVYEVADDNERYRVELVKELVDVKAGISEVEGFNAEELDTILNYLCTT